MAARIAPLRLFLLVWAGSAVRIDAAAQSVLSQITLNVGNAPGAAFDNIGCQPALNFDGGTGTDIRSSASFTAGGGSVSRR